MTLRDYQRGDKFAPEASQLNAWNAAARAHLAGDAGESPASAPRQWLTLGQNTGSTLIERFDAVQLLGPAIRDDENAFEFDALTAFDVEHTTDELGGGLVAIAQESIGPGKLGRVLVFGVSPCRELVVVDESHTRARYGPSGELVSADEGPVAILWKSLAGQSPRRAIVSIAHTNAQSPAATRWGRIVASSQDLDAYRWDYTVQLVELDGSFDWQPIPGEALVAARNTIEASNTNAGPQGNGVDADKLPQGFDIVPIGAGAVVELKGPYGVTQSDPGFYLFSETNLVDGECTPP